MHSVGHAFGILKGYMTGNPEEAEAFINSMHPAEVQERGKQESRNKNKLRKRAIKVGSMPRKWSR
jgi:hypothetical protein